MDKVLIVGGGLAGLSALHTLKKLSPELEVTLVDAQDHLGGRAYSLPFGGEAGCSQPFFYEGPALKLIRELGLNVQSYQGSKIRMGLYLEGQALSLQDWPKSDINDLKGALQKVPPFMFFNPLALSFPPPTDWQQDSPDLNQPILSQLATQTTAEFMQSKGIPEKWLPHACANFYVFEDPQRISALSSMLRAWVARPTGTFFHFQGNYGDVVNRLAPLADRLHLGDPVKSVTPKPDYDYVEVETRAGKQFLADYVIFAAPPKAIQSVVPLASLPPVLQMGLENLAMTPVIKLFYQGEASFWSRYEGVTALLSDTVFDTCFPVFDVKTRTTPFSGPDMWGFEVCLIGTKALACEHSLETLQAQVLDTLEKAWPHTKGRLRYHTGFDWRAGSMSGGALHYFPPGKHAINFYDAISSPQERMFFAGEHTCYRYQGYDGAIFSGKRAASKIFELLTEKRVCS